MNGGAAAPTEAFDVVADHGLQTRAAQIFGLPGHIGRAAWALQAAGEDRALRALRVARQAGTTPAAVGRQGRSQSGALTLRPDIQHAKDGLDMVGFERGTGAARTEGGHSQAGATRLDFGGNAAAAPHQAAAVIGSLAAAGIRSESGPRTMTGAKTGSAYTSRRGFKLAVLSASAIPAPSEMPRAATRGMDSAAPTVSRGGAPSIGTGMPLVADRAIDAGQMIGLVSRKETSSPMRLPLAQSRAAFTAATGAGRLVRRVAAAPEAMAMTRHLIPLSAYARQAASVETSSVSPTTQTAGAIASGSIGGAEPSPAHAGYDQAGWQSDRGGSAAKDDEGTMHGDVYLDGTLMGRWISRNLAREAGRPANGSAAFDPRRNVYPTGAMIGG